MWRINEAQWALLALFGLAGGACGGSTQTETPPPRVDGGIDSGVTVADAAPDTGENASGVADGGFDGTGAHSGDAAADVIDTVQEDGGGDAADATDAANGADAEDASVPIPCSETATCAAPVSLGTIWGGVQGGINETVATYGDHSEWYQVAIDSYQPPVDDDVNVAIYFESLADVEFDVDVYLTTIPSQPPVTCSQPIVSSIGDGGVAQPLQFSFPDRGLSGPLAWVTIHVIAKPGSQCMTGDSYWLQLTTAQ